MTTSPTLLLLLCFLHPLLYSAFSQECNEATMRRCRREGLNAIDSSNRPAGDIKDQCANLRENFDCVLWQTSMCSDKDGQDDNRDTIVRMWRYMQSFCESQGSWYTKACFQRDDVKRCESLLPTRGTSVDPSSCRSFSSFRNCVTAIAQIDCSTSDQKFLGTYLMEKGQQRAWNCPRDQNDLYPASAPLSDTFSLSEASYGRCSESAKSDLQECRNQFYSTQKEAQEHNDSDMRHHITCCAMVRYEDCVQRGIEEYCGDSRGKSEAKSIVADMRERFPYQSCGDHTMTECSAGNKMAVSLVACMLLIMITHFISSKCSSM